jgi:hypothetical protein
MRNVVPAVVLVVCLLLGALGAFAVYRHMSANLEKSDKQAAHTWRSVQATVLDIVGISGDGTQAIPKLRVSYKDWVNHTDRVDDLPFYGGDVDKGSQIDVWVSRDGTICKYVYACDVPGRNGIRGGRYGEDGITFVAMMVFLGGYCLGLLGFWLASKHLNPKPPAVETTAT